ncbi:MAG: RIP metalloprotease RseP [Parvibaculum sp.]|nr:RIP metalloprotease RseP [Parvibaculum sp.]
MDLLTGMGNFGTSAVGYIIPFLFVLTVVVFFHELGHFLVARWCGVKVDVFSIGFGREIFGRTDKHGTRWKLSWIPLGGYVKFAGDENAASMPDAKAMAGVPENQRAGLFFFKPLHQRAAVVAAGPFANFLLSIVIFAAIFSLVGQRTALAVVDSVQAGSAAEAAGFKSDDRIVSINGSAIGGFEDMQRIVSISPEVPLTFGVVRADTEITLIGTPRLVEIKDGFDNVQRIGQLGLSRKSGPGTDKIVKTDPFTSVVKGAGETWFIVSRTFSFLGGMLAGREDSSQLGGPLRIAEVSGQVATLGFVALLNLTAVLSVSIGLLNLFPVPMLDGGHLLYYAIEGAKGKPLGEKAQEFGFRIGLALVMMLMVFATWNDLVRLFT